MTTPQDPRQDPLPEPSFPWRRGLSFLGTVLLWLLLGLALVLLPATDVLPFAQGLMLLLALVWLLYFGGASAADITLILATLRQRLRMPWQRRPRKPAPAPGELPADQRIEP